MPRRPSTSSPATARSVRTTRPARRRSSRSSRTSSSSRRTMRSGTRNLSCSRSELPLHMTEAQASTTGRAGRNLPVEIVVGLALGALILGTLYTVNAAVLGVVVAAILVGLWELVRSLQQKEMRAPFVPLAVGTCCLLILASTDGREAMTVAALLTG